MTGYTKVILFIWPGMSVMVSEVNDRTHQLESVVKVSNISDTVKKKVKTNYLKYSVEENMKYKINNIDFIANVTSDMGTKGLCMVLKSLSITSLGLKFPVEEIIHNQFIFQSSKS